ncbi:MAG TPA: glucoamylase family protein [Candidatus Eisenbacteria bacterium]|jgi:hypothetical protein
MKTERLLALLLALVTVPLARSAAAETTDAILDSLQYGAFRYFWDEANPANGLIHDRSQPGSVCSIASTGFGLSAVCIGADHGWVSRADARGRVLTTLQTFWNGPQGSAASGTIGYLGLYYHWLDMTTATRTWDSELSTIDTALLFAGILDAKQYFDTGDADEVQIRALADSIYRRANWYVMRNFSAGIYMGWKPVGGFNGFGKWQGYNEAMILYLLAIGAPVASRAAPASDWTYWTASYSWGTQYGYSYVTFPPLFGHQYSHCWIDFRGLQDAYLRQPAHGIDYFENSRRATLAQQAYCIANPGGFVGYSDTLWGITASDCPTGYCARGAPPPQGDNGTIAPTAVAGSLPFAPEICVPTLRSLYATYKPGPLWSKYGFRDAFNLTSNPDWYGADVLGIDQGPIIIMIENYRTGRVWQRFMRNLEILQGLHRAGFTGDALAADDPSHAGAAPLALGVRPNPFSERTTLRYRLPRPARVRLALYDVAGREVAKLVDAEEEAGEHEVEWRGGGLRSGIYYCRLEAGGMAAGRWIARMR